MTAAAPCRLTHGPFAVPVWDAEAGAWACRLTDEGRARCAEYLEEYPAPVKYLRARHACLHRLLVRNGFTEDDLHALCLRAVVAAVVRWRPDEAGLTTVVWWSLRCEAQRELARVVRVRRRERCAADRLPEPAAPEPPEPPDPDDAAALARLLARLTPRQREVVVAVHCGGATGPAVARRLGLSRERVRQVKIAALAQMRRAAGVSH